jgi:uncharacterized protein DUF2330
MQRILSSLLLILLPLTALADGMFVPTVALPANVTIPDQRALIQFTNGTERLVIETRFTGAGTNFAWVVPLSSQPVIEEASTGLFPTLQHLFRPQIIHNVPGYYVGILILLGIGYLFRLAVRSVWNGFVIAFVLLLLLLLAALLLPALAKGKAGGMDSVSSGQTVSILDRKLVGIFETTTIASSDAKALQVWLSQNGFAVPTNAEPVIASYVKDGWVFVAAKVRRDNAGLETNTPHPLSFTFKTDKPVYPMRLTGVDNGPLDVELYVFGPSRAEAPHFKVERCTRPNYSEPPSNDFLAWARWSLETPDIVHPLLRKWVDGSPVATKLTATLSPADMRQDVWLEWMPFREKKNHLFSRDGAATLALNWGAGVLAIGLLGACMFASRKDERKRKLPRLAGVIWVMSALAGGLIYLALPKIEVRLVKRSASGTMNTHYELSHWLGDADATNVVAMRTVAKRLLANPPDSWLKNHPEMFENLLGGRIHEEDSPGNYIIREKGGRLEFVSYDAQGAEHVLEIKPW